MMVLRARMTVRSAPGAFVSLFTVAMNICDGRARVPGGPRRHHAMLISAREGAAEAAGRDRHLRGGGGRRHHGGALPAAARDAGGGPQAEKALLHAQLRSKSTIEDLQEKALEIAALIDGAKPCNAMARPCCA